MRERKEGQELPLSGGEEKEEGAGGKKIKNSHTAPLKNNLATSQKLYWSYVPYWSRNSVSPVCSIFRNKL